MKDIRLFKQAVAIEYPTLDVNDFDTSSQGDLLYKGYYQNGYGTELVTETFHSVGRMDPDVKEVFDAWLHL